MKWFSMIIFALIISSTEGLSQTSKVKVEVNDLYSLELPDYLEEAPDLKVNASLKFRNLSKKLHVIAIDEEKAKINALPKGATISDCYTHITTQVAQKLEDAIINPPSAETLGSLNALQGGINGKFLGTDLRYIVELVESDTHYYQVICWTEETALSDVGNDIHQIINSFKELPTPPSPK